MALSQSTVVGQVRDLIATLTGLERVYAQSENDANRIPDGILECPCVIVLAGPTKEYLLTQPRHAHAYEVRTLWFEDGPDSGERALSLLPMTDRLIEMLTDNVTFGGVVTYCMFRRSSGLAVLNWNDAEYDGMEITLEVRETASTTAAVGAAP